MQPLDELRGRVHRHEQHLHLQMLPWWKQRVDTQHGGFLLAPNEKQLATQSRMVWVFAHAHRKGYGDYLEAAEQGLRFVRERFRDPKHGGYYWSTDRAGRVRSRRKILYGHVFVISALVEYFRATGDRGALDEAEALFDVLSERAYDTVHGGWLEHFRRRWRPARVGARGYAVEIAGLKSGNTQLHTMEAFTELFDAGGRREVGVLLAETADVCAAWFFPEDPGEASLHRTRSFGRAGRAGTSPGHNIEFAWLVLRAERSLARPSSRPRFDAYVGDTIRRLDGERVWWADAELIAALAVDRMHWADDRWHEALGAQLDFVEAHVVDPEDGVWRHSVDGAGRVLNDGRVDSWKDAFHEARALSLLAEAFAGDVSSADG